MTDRQDVVDSAYRYDEYRRITPVYWNMVSRNMDMGRFIHAAHGLRLALSTSIGLYISGSRFVHDYTASEAYREYPMPQSHHRGKLLAAARDILADQGARLPEPTIWGKLSEAESES